jgi:hypothetical protein
MRLIKRMIANQGGRFLEIIVLRDKKFLIYGGGLFAGFAVASPLLPSHAALCIDNRVMCAPPSPEMGDEPSRKEPGAPNRINPLSVAASTASVTQPLHATIVFKV